MIRDLLFSVNMHLTPTLMEYKLGFSSTELQAA